LSGKKKHPARSPKKARLSDREGLPGDTTLKNIDVSIPLGVLSLRVTGVSGSGNHLVNETSTSLAGIETGKDNRGF
jgi:excinuclease UvrABC ATPase subunit